MVIKLDGGNEYREGRIDKIERVRKGDRLKSKLSERTDLGPATTTLDVITEINATVEAQEPQIEVSTAQEAQMEIPAAEEIQERQGEDVWLSGSDDDDDDDDDDEEEEEEEEEEEGEEGPESLLDSSIEIAISPTSTPFERSRTSTPSPSRWRTPRPPKTPSRRIRLPLLTKSHRHRRPATPERPPPPQTTPEVSVAPLQPTFEPLRQPTPSRIPRRSEGLLQARETLASPRATGGSKIPRPSPGRQEQRATSVQEENTMVIEGTTSRYGRVRRGRRIW